MIAVNHQKAVFSTMFVTAPAVSRDPRAHASFGRAPPCFINTFMTIQQSPFSTDHLSVNIIIFMITWFVT